jgi:hypothetical protein
MALAICSHLFRTLLGRDAAAEEGANPWAFGDQPSRAGEDLVTVPLDTSSPIRRDFARSRRISSAASHGAELPQRRLCVQCPSQSIASLMMAFE